MRRRPRVLAVMASACATLLGVGVEASNVIHMPLRDLVERADRIVRGAVISAREDQLAAGGGSLPIVVYRIHVEEALKGAVAAGEDIDVRMVSQPKQTVGGRYRRVSVLADLPRFAVGREYLFVLTRPSAIGLSTTVGLGQGLFMLRGRPGQELAVNEANNLGLLDGGVGVASRSVSGPVAYSALVTQIRTLLAR
jgi:hypothetical protein